MLEHHIHSCHSIEDSIVLSLFGDYLERQFDHDRVTSANVGTPHSFMPFDWTPNCFLIMTMYSRPRLAKQKDLVEALNQELDGQDHKLSLERSRYFTHTTALRQLYEQERQHMPRGICMPVRRRR